MLPHIASYCINIGIRLMSYPGLLKPVEFDEVLATASKKVSELANISLDSVSWHH